MDDKDVNAGIINIFRKVITTGIGAAFMNEEGVKELINGLPLPKDIVNGLLQNAKNSKDEFILSLKSELKSYLSTVDVSEEIEKIVENYDFEISAKISLTPKKRLAETIAKKKVLKKKSK